MLRKLLTILAVTTVLLAVSICNLANDTQTYGPTTADDHLWYIAQKTRPNRDISKQQMMIALLKANPEAFADNNVNGLRAGQHLRIPTLEVIKAISPVTALLQISAQNLKWLNKIDFEQPTRADGSKAPPFGTIKHARDPESIQIHQTFSNPTTETAQAQNTTTLESNSVTVTQPIVSKEISLPPQQRLLNELVPSISLNDPFTDILQAALPSNNLSTPFKPIISFNVPIIQALTSALQARQETKTAISPNGIITAITAETLIKNGIATHISNLTQQVDNFIIRFNDLDKYTRERLDIIEDEHVAMKNQIASLDKQLKQLKENYLQYSTPVFHHSAFSDYGIWIMGSSVLACLLVLIFTVSRKRRSHDDVTKKISATITKKKSLPEEEVEIVEVIEDEYDYLGSQEGVAAKLDLARAYIDMGDSSQAAHVLNEVITHGNEEQRYKARKILADIIQDTVH
ncbi:MAG: hypothetical protein K2X50_06410 [Gammaproteobacteria bacterium]|nr:hypothetical protein [Gammaproteobacteria bacterium]